MMTALTMQLVGIPGSGKSHLLQLLMQTYGDQRYGVFEFGTRLRSYISAGNIPTDASIRKTLAELASLEKPQIISAHIVHFSNGRFEYNLSYDRITNSIAYIHIVTPPEQIFNYRLADNKSTKRIRQQDSIDDIMRHQELSLSVSTYIAKEIGADHMVLNTSTGSQFDHIRNIHAYALQYFSPIKQETTNSEQQLLIQRENR